jgi:hypothetical protein
MPGAFLKVPGFFDSGRQKSALKKGYEDGLLARNKAG